MVDNRPKNDSIITAPTKMAEMSTSALDVELPLDNSILEQMRKTGTMNNIEKAERLEEIVQEAAQETRL